MKRLASLLLLLSLFLLCCGCADAPEPAPVTEKLRIAVMSDVHYTGESYRYAGVFRSANDASGTGKQVELLPSLMDAFIAQMLRERPDYLLITGDNSFNGARVSHEALVEKLEPLREAGVVILTLPGNHDIDGAALVFPIGEAEQGQPISAEDFASLYADFGYRSALSRDPSSLSYVFDTGRGLRIFMLDTCFRYGAVYGRVGEETLAWLSRELDLCCDAGDVPLVAGHHNALVHHPLFSFGYTVDDSEALRALLLAHGDNLYLSGHLHPQSIVWEEGFCDAATESFAVFPHRWALLEIEGRAWRYTARETDVERWAAENGLSDERLLHYSVWGRQFFADTARAQAEASFAAVEDEALRAALSEFFAEANIGYFMGTPAPPAEGELHDAVFALGGRSGFYLQTITDLPSSLSAEGVFG